MVLGLEWGLGTVSGLGICPWSWSWSGSLSVTALVSNQDVQVAGGGSVLGRGALENDVPGGVGVVVNPAGQLRGVCGQVSREVCVCESDATLPGISQDLEHSALISDVLSHL